MDLTYGALKNDIASKIAHAKIITDVDETAKRLLQDRSRFLSVQRTSGVPALWLMPVFERENPSFKTYFGNGDPLTEKTTHVPRNRGPFENWEAGVVDALSVDHIVHVTDWSWTHACYLWESWNGFGPREFHRVSGYVYAGTDQYAGGKFVADGVWSRGTWDKQPGCFVIAKAIAKLDPEIGKGLTEEIINA